MIERSDGWAVSRRYLSLERLAKRTDTDPLRVPAAAA